MAFDEKQDGDLIALDACHLFEPSLTKIAFRRGSHLRGYMAGFIEIFAPHISAVNLQRQINENTQDEIEAHYADVNLPDL